MLSYQSAHHDLALTGSPRWPSRNSFGVGLGPSRFLDSSHRCSRDSGSGLGDFGAATATAASLATGRVENFVKRLVELPGHVVGEVALVCDSRVGEREPIWDSMSLLKGSCEVCRTRGTMCDWRCGFIGWYARRLLMRCSYLKGFRKWLCREGREVKWFDGALMKTEVVMRQCLKEEAAIRSDELRATGLH